MISEIETGARSIASRPPNRISPIGIVSAALGPEVTEPMYGLSDSVWSAKTMSRWRESSGRSSGSQIVPPGESSSGKELGEPDEVLEVGHLRVAAHVALADERAAVDGGEHHVVAADVRVVGRVAGLQLELAGRLGHLLEDELGVEADAVLVLHDLAGAAQELDRLGQQELDPELGHDPPPAPVEHCHRVLAEDLVAGHVVDEQAATPSIGA